MKLQPKLLPALFLTLAAGMLAVAASAVLWMSPVLAAGAPGPAMPAQVWTWGLLAAALATGLSSLAAAYAVAKVGAASVGALAEKPELFGRLVILVGLSEGIAIYGLIVSVLILNSLILMPAPVLIADELTAAGYRLTGMRVLTPAPEAAAQALEQARAQAPLVLITAELAAGIPSRTLDTALAALSPLTLIVADVRARVPAPDAGAQARRRLGVLE